MNINPINICATNSNMNKNKISFGAFIPECPNYLRTNLCARDITKLSNVVGNIQNTKYYDLKVIDKGFAIINKITQKIYQGDIGIQTFGMWGEGGTWLVDNKYSKAYDKSLVSLDNLTNDDWEMIEAKYPDLKQMSVGEKYVYYTDLLDLNQQRLIEKNLKQEKENINKASERKDTANKENTYKEAAIANLMRQFGNRSSS